MNTFVWTKMQKETGQELEDIITAKEKQRQAGAGTFWWGIGNSLGTAVIHEARAAGGILPVVFSKMLSAPKEIDVSPKQVFRWTHWVNENGCKCEIPHHVTVISRGYSNKRSHYALVCYSDEPLQLAENGWNFDPDVCKTLAGKPPGSSQVTALLRGNLAEPHRDGDYRIAFRAKLVEPWFVKLVAYQEEQVRKYHS